MVPNFETQRLNPTLSHSLLFSKAIDQYHSHITIFVSPTPSVLEIGILFHWKSREDAERVPPSLIACSC
jgi:hypothetical protein